MKIRLKTEIRFYRTTMKKNILWNLFLTLPNLMLLKKNRDQRDSAQANFLNE